MFCDICKKNGLLQYRVVSAKKKIGFLLVRIVGKNLLKMRDIDTAELEKQIVEVKNNYQLKPLL